MTETTENVTWLTQEAYDRLKAERDHLAGDGRTEIAKKIEAARDEGDLRENGGYHAAKEEQGKMEARIRQLTQLLESAVVGAKPADDGIVEPGMVVTVEIKDDSDLEVFSEQSPLGRAINGKKVGEAASYETPAGKTVEVKILKAAPFTG